MITMEIELEARKGKFKIENSLGVVFQGEDIPEPEIDLIEFALEVLNPYWVVEHDEYKDS